MDMEPIEGADKATRLLKSTYVDKVVYVESVEPLQQVDITHATWTALVMWYKTGEISGVLVGPTPFHMCSIKSRILPVTSPMPVHPAFPDNGCPFPQAPARPKFTLAKSTERSYWIRIVDMEPIDTSGMLDPGKTETAIRAMYIGKIVYIESVEPLQSCEIELATWTALI